MAVAWIRPPRSVRMHRANGFAGERQPISALREVTIFTMLFTLVACTTMRKLPSMLFAWGDWWIKHFENFGHPPINWIYRLVHEGGARPDITYDTDDNGEVFVDQDKILCPEMPKNVRKVQLAVNRLPNLEEKCVTFRYCSPLKDDGNPYTKRELARFLSMSKYSFDSHLRNGRKKISNLLTD